MPVVTNSTSSSISKLKERVSFRKGMARSNRFVIDFSAIGPKLAGIANIDDASFDDLNYFCETCSLPGRTTNTVEYGPWHREIKIPIGYVNDDVEMTFNLTNDYFIKKLLDAWAGLIINYDNYLLNYDNMYRADIKIYQLDLADKVTYAVTLFDAYPYSIKAIDLNNADNDAIAKCSASFAYRDFKTIDPLNTLGTPIATITPPTPKPQLTGVNNMFTNALNSIVNAFK